MHPSAPVEIPYDDHGLVPVGEGAELFARSSGTQSPVITTTAADLTPTAGGFGST